MLGAVRSHASTEWAVEGRPSKRGFTPGPACYGRGGVEPTVTDADVVLGYLDPNYFLGGEMKLDAEAARRAIYDRLPNH